MNAVRLLALVVLTSCAKAPAPAEPSPSTSAPSAASVSAAASAGTPAPRWLGEGCHAGTGLDGSAEARGRRVAEACAPGAAPLAEPELLPAPGEVRWSLGAKAGCLRVIAVAEHTDADVTLELSDEKGSLASADSLPGSVALAGARGPVCFGPGAELRAKVGFAAGTGRIAVGAYRMQ